MEPLLKAIYEFSFRDSDVASLAAETTTAAIVAAAT
jgi:hypothetical protein